MNGLVLAPAYDTGTPEHPHDATGAFQPRAKQFAKLHGFPSPTLLDNRPSSMRVRELELTSAITKTPPPVDVVALFCHGMRDHVQLGPTLDTVGDFARTLKAVAAGDLTVCLYACLTGEDLLERGKRPPVHSPGAGDGSFADTLRDALLALGARPRVISHTTAGDAWDNHYVRVFDATRTRGGEWLVEPGSADWPEWNHRMHTTDMWARMPFLSRDEVLAELRTSEAR